MSRIHTAVSAAAFFLVLALLVVFVGAVINLGLEVVSALVK